MQNHDLRTFPAGKHLRSFSLALLGALCAFQVSASKLSDLNKFGVTQNGNSAKIGAWGSGSWDSAIPIAQPSGGWASAGNYGIPQAAKGPTVSLGADGKVFFADGIGVHGGVHYPFQAVHEIPGTSIVDAIGAIAGGPIGMAVFAAPFVLEWLTSSGGRVSPTDPTALERTDPSVCTVAPCYVYRVVDYETTFESPSFATACGQARSAFDARFSGYIVPVTTSYPTCNANRYSAGGEYEGLISWNNTRVTVLPSGSAWLPSSMDDIAPYMKQTPFDPRVIGEVLDKGGDIPFPAPTVSGPSEILGPQSETPNPDGSKTVSQPKSFFTFQGDTVTNTKNETTVTVVNVDNSVRTVTTTTTTPVASSGTQKTEDPCLANPDRNGCRKDHFDVPEGEIPKTTKTITFAAENLGFAGGSCPANRTQVIGNGQTITTADWVTTCDMTVTYAKPMILIMATFAAMMIIFGFGSGRSES